MKKSTCFSIIMLGEIVLVSVLFQITTSFELFDDDSHQGVLTRMEKPGFWTLLEDKKQPNGVYNRLDRRIFKLPQTIIPYPRAGRMILDSDLYDYDLSLVPDYALNLDYPFANGLLDKTVSDKRASIAFPPRIGRKKRSISTEQNNNDDDSDVDQKRQDVYKLHTRSEMSQWSDFDDFEPDIYLRSDRSRPNSRSRNSFVPRVGKKSSGSVLEEMESKRALAFTPRIGRASLIPRIGRNDPRFKVKSRGSFIPRIGRRAALIPRIGRSESHASTSKESQ